MEESINSVRVGSKNNGASPPEAVADILERQVNEVIQEWLGRVEKEPDLTCIALTFQERTGHLPQLLHDVIRRLRMDEGLLGLRFRRRRAITEICGVSKATQ